MGLCVTESVTSNKRKNKQLKQEIKSLFQKTLKNENKLYMNNVIFIS